MLSRRLIYLLLLIFGFSTILVPDSKGQDEKLKAIFVYNFTRYIDWPDKSGNFVIIVLGKSPISAELNEIALKKRVGTTPIQVISVNSVQEISEGHIVYITSGKSDQMASLSSLSRSKNMLVITEKEGLCKNGSGINFILKDSKLSFEISKNNVNACGLTVSSALFALGSVVNE